MNDLAERRDSRSPADLETAAEDGGDASQPSSSEKVGKVRHRDGLRPGAARDRANREGGRERAGGAHPETLSDREFVGHSHPEGAGDAGCHAAGDVLGDRPWTAAVSDHADVGPSPRDELGFDPRPELEDDAGPDRTSGARVPSRGVGPEHPRHMAGSERTSSESARNVQSSHPGLAFESTYKPTRCMNGNAPGAG